MGTLSGIMSLFLVCALRAENDPLIVPCEERRRYRHNHSEPEVVWGSTVAILGSVGALLMLAQYIMWLLNKDQCPEEREKCETQKEDLQETGKKADRGRPGACGSGELACHPARDEPSPGLCNQIQQAYAQRLANMEQHLEALLHEVKSQRSNLQYTQLEAEYLPSTTENGSDKLRISVYEIADLEDISDTQPKRRKRQFQ